MVKYFYQVLFEGAGAETEQLAAQVSQVTYELTQYLCDVLLVDSVDASFEGKVAYHPCCHLLRELDVDRQPRGLLASADGIDVVDLPAATECCGFGGLFAIKNAGISTAMGKRKVESVVQSGADVVAVADVSCMTHINGMLGKTQHECRAVHIAELLNSAGRSERT
jgi:L-lactate dehydrogenase complex protein LldE